MEDSYKSSFTWTMFFYCLIASTGGALFGYDNGITGGVVSMKGFIEKFFPEIAEENRSHDLYCIYNNGKLQWFVSSLFVAASILEISGISARIIRSRGRRETFILSGISFFIGSVIQASSEYYWMLIVGRSFLGIGISFSNISVPMYLIEMSPPYIRGRITQLFQLSLTGAILIAQIVNIPMSRIYPWGWRVSLGGSMIPSIILIVGGILISDTPNSLAERGKMEEAEIVLRKIRGTHNIKNEMNDIRHYAFVSQKIKHPWFTIIRRKYRGQLIIAIVNTFFQQWTGINTIIFYAPQLFISLGNTKSQSLIASLIVGLCNHLSTYVSFILCDIYGRKTLFISAGIQMFIALLIIAISLALMTSYSLIAYYILLFICIFDSAYAWSWGPLAWLYPIEVQPLETRSSGAAIVSFMNSLFSFVIGQTYLTMLCGLKWTIFLIFASMVIIMTCFVYFLFPESNGVPIELCPFIFKDHWFWNKWASIHDSIQFQEEIVRNSIGDSIGSSEIIDIGLSDLDLEVIQKQKNKYNEKIESNIIIAHNYERFTKKKDYKKKKTFNTISLNTIME